MPRTRPPYPPEFRQQIVELSHSGRTVTELAAEFEPSEQTIRTWVAQTTNGVTAPAHHLPTSDQEELKRLRQENRQLRQERDILAKAAAWFARETNSIPPKSSNS